MADVTVEQVKIGDRIQIKEWKHLFQSFRTRQWMANHYGTVLRVNAKTVTVQLDSYPAEKHYIDYGDFYILDHEDDGSWT